MLTEHTASVPVIIQVVSGALTVEVAGARHRMGDRSWLYLEAGERHSIRADEPSHMLLTMIR
jgi:quercetin dioxygenase-like cupin family protein